MNTRDPLGYYDRLGVEPSATAAQIKTAYRERAMEFHPDRNSGQDTTAQFQELQRAYKTLSNADSRSAYDASAIDPGKEREESGKSSSYEPIRCSRCNSVSATPRYRVYFTVYGYFFGATKSPRQGIFCARCEALVALRATAISAVAGWWSLFGLIWTLESIAKNLFGWPTFLEQNAKLLAYQAGYFQFTGNTNLARAVASQAFELASKASKSKSGIDKRRAKLGYSEDDSLKDLRERLRAFLSSFADQGPTPRLLGASTLWNARLGYQAAFLGVAISLLVGWALYANKMEAEAEQARLEQLGIAREAAIALARAQRNELRKHELPLPLTGVYAHSDGGPFDPNEMPPFKVITQTGSNYLLKLADWNTGVPVLSVFIRGGENLEIGVPPGTYRIKIASGATWYGDDIRFGPSTEYSEVNQPSTFSTIGNHLEGHELKLINVPNGNLHREPITASQF